MSKKLYEESNIQEIANAIREKNGEETTYKVSEMAEVIRNLPSSGAIITSLNVTKNGTYSSPSGIDGYSPVTVNVPSADTHPPTPDILLPEGYTRLEYIYCNGDAYISGIEANSMLPILEAEFLISDQEQSSDVRRRLMGMADTGVNDYDWDVETDLQTNAVRVALWYRQGPSAFWAYNASSMTIGRNEKMKVTVIGVNPVYITNYHQKYNIASYRSNGGNAAAGLPFIGNLYGWNERSPFNNNSYVKYCVPCTNTSSIPGFYDAINNVFMRSSSGIDFQAGPIYEQGS